MGKATPFRTLKTLGIGLLLLLAVYYFHGFSDVLSFIGSVWACIVFAGLSVVLWEESRGFSIGKALVGMWESIRNARWWLTDERDRFKEGCKYEAAKLEPSDLEQFERNRELVFVFFDAATRRFKKALIAGISITLFVWLVQPLYQGILCGMMIIGAPFLIQSREDSTISLHHFPLDQMRKITRRREIFADAVWSNLIMLVTAGVIGYAVTGKLREYQP